MNASFAQTSKHNTEHASPAKSQIDSCFTGGCAQTATADYAVKFDRVSYSYDGEHQALENVSFTIAQGSLTALVGGNGSGKSTIAKLIDGLIVPRVGQVYTGGYDVADDTCINDIRMRTGLVFQNPDNQLVASLVKHEVAFGPENLGIERASLIERVGNALVAVGLEGFEPRETYTLSGGQKQRVAVASALTLHPTMLVLDEAQSMLDPHGRHRLLQLAQQLNDKGMTILMITHDMDEACIADNLIVMQSGHVIAQGAPREILTADNAEESLGLALPFAVDVSLKLRRAHVDIPVCLTEDELECALCEWYSNR